ncbi:peritrophin-48-like isoform X2 [Portunus trituberculatus]|uniref:peritrophin-48-like isoform X2 n=1 Tax=Portunus trituberculatus TaxID=210409 RepID=UPI001E1CDAA9|nr:peritrophin-48-like isoform X2 [Portunus trituberculatus]
MSLGASCLLLPLLFIALARVILVDAQACGDIGPDTCKDDAATLCAGCTNGVALVPNPFDCSSYYVCKDETTFITDDSLLCPDGDIFDENELACKPDGNCSFNCEQPGDGGDCLYTCEGNPGGKIADPFDCSMYHQCTGTEPGPATTCPADTPYFDGEKCGVDESACCHCRPYCYSGDDAGSYVEDPTDCRKFFLCLAENEIPTIQSACRDGEHFDLHTRQCSSTAPCVTLCRNLVDENGCIDPYTCQEAGFFSKCKTQCLREYYHCEEVSDDYAPTETCSDDLVFNPDTVQCIESESCPYSHQYLLLDPVPA